MAVHNWILSLALVGLSFALLYNAFVQSSDSNGEKNNRSIFEFSANRADDADNASLESFKGKKAYLVVNVASKCGLTDRNYAELQELYEKLSPKGLEILAFPCNNFGGQEPGTDEEIVSYAREVKAATFPVLGKLECDNGDQTHPLYKYLKSSLSGGILGAGLKWNFAKFLCDADGIPIKRYNPLTSPLAIEKDILPLLQ